VYNSRKVGGGGSRLSCSLLDFFESCIWIETTLMRNGNGPNNVISITWSPKPWSDVHGHRVRTPAAGSFKTSRTCPITVETVRWPVMKKRSHYGLISSELVNAHDAVHIRNGQLVSFEKSWPDGFTLLSKLVLEIAVKKKVAKFG